jgi:uncharacterized repeat protein (TIGR03803 family)
MLATMKRICAGLLALSVLPVAGCSQQTSRSSALPYVETGSVRAKDGFKSLFSFVGDAGGGHPSAKLIRVNGAFYGVTFSGGRTAGAKCGIVGCGAIFEVKPSGKERVVYRFKGGTDGSYPGGELLARDGVFYGTTTGGGQYGDGTVFAFDASGGERVLHSFNRSNGENPVGGLIAMNGVLFGTTALGGAHRVGTVYRLAPSGSSYAYSVVYSFKGGAGDGAQPNAGLIADASGNLYGTTIEGGIGRASPCQLGCGTVFKLTAVESHYAESILYAFKGASDGANPSASLFVEGDGLFGTTYYGGAAAGTQGYGTVFEVSTPGEVRVLYTFKGSSDGAHPLAGLISMNGRFYGTASQGGSPACYDRFQGIVGCGVVFELSRAGEERVLPSSRNSVSGWLPIAGLTALRSTLYGTTENGGTSGKIKNQSGCFEIGCGTVFSLTP